MAIQHSNFEAIGTKWHIEVRHQLASGVWEELLSRIQTRIHKFDVAYSRFRSDSLVHQMSLKPGSYALPDDGYKLLSFYEKLYSSTAGKVTPLIGQAMKDAGYDAEYSLQPKQMQPTSKWEDIISYDEQSITLSHPALLDFGAVGKGYLVDIVGELIIEAGIQDFTIDASGDILHRGSEPLRVGLENPNDTSEAVGIVELGNKSLCASAGSKRQWGKFTHIIDPDKLASPRTILATWVMADDTMTADGLATALFFTDPTELQQQFDFLWAVLNNDMSLEYAKDFPVEIFAAE